MNQTARQSAPVAPIAAVQPCRESEVSAAFRGEPHDRLDVGHSQLAYWRFGTGPDLVMVHGWPLHSATFRKIIPLLADSMTCHVFDLPGTGKTGWSEGAPIDLESHGETVRRAIDRIGLDRYAMLSHDSGAVAARLAVAGDSRLSALVMGNTEIPGHHSRYIDLFLLLAKIPGGKSLLLQSMKLGPMRRSSLGFGGCFTDPRYAEGEFAEWFLRPLVESKEVAAGHLRLLDTLDLSVVDRLPEVHGRIAAPVQMVWGPKDHFFPIGKARAILDQFPGGAELVEIERGRLFAHEDRATEFAAACKPFLLRAFANRAIKKLD